MTGRPDSRRETETDAGTAPTPAGAPGVLDRIAGIAIAIAAAALAGLVLVQGWQVVARYVLNDSPSWTEPVTVLLLSTAMSFGAAAGVHTRRHFSFSLLADAMRPHVRRVVDAINVLVIAGIGAVLAVWGAVLLFDALDVRIAGAPMPQSIGFLPLSLGGALMVLFALARLPGIVRGHGGEG
ncbi:TRAP transporter small permease [Luteimonas saliphila]|uniref:TRAP transporter small permease n=1 Tax=Luteimonas saliphila TaxID=2804919 RepID=UPI00192DB964|nr:TRAP transporter small permease [Luteimonas saliphila]